MRTAAPVPTDSFQRLIADAVRVAVREELASRPTLNRLRSIEEAAAYLSLSKREVYNMIANRELPPVPRGRRKMLDIRDLDSWIDRNKLPC